MAPTKIEHTLVIKRPIEEVFAYIVEVGNYPSWAEKIVEARQTSEGPVEAGTTCYVVNQSMGKKLKHDFVVSEYELNKKYIAKSTSGPFPMELGYTVEPVDGGTKVQVVSQAELRGLFKMAGPLLNRMLRKQIEADHANLKTLLESRT